MGTLTNLLAQLDPDSKKRKGDQFEAICNWFLENDRRFGHLVQVWLWDDWPGNWGPDNGIDLVAKDNEGRIWAIQAKAYQANYRIKKTDVDSFLTESARKVIAAAHPCRPGRDTNLLVTSSSPSSRRAC